MRRDPYRIVLAGLSSVLGALLKTTVNWRHATDAVIAARNPLPPEHMEALVRRLEKATAEGAKEGANVGVRTEARRFIRTLDRALAVKIGLCVGGAYVAGALTLFAAQWGTSTAAFSPAAAWQGIMAVNPDPRPILAGADVRTDPVSGRRYYACLPLWLDPQRAPPATAAK